MYMNDMRRRMLCGTTSKITTRRLDSTTAPTTTSIYVTLRTKTMRRLGWITRMEEHKNKYVDRVKAVVITRRKQGRKTRVRRE